MRGEWCDSGMGDVFQGGGDGDSSVGGVFEGGGGEVMVMVV